MSSFSINKLTQPLKKKILRVEYIITRKLIKRALYWESYYVPNIKLKIVEKEENDWVIID